MGKQAPIVPDRWIRCCALPRQRAPEPERNSMGNVAFADELIDEIDESEEEPEDDEDFDDDDFDDEEDDDEDDEP
jgi:hypothetical protein